MTNVITFDSKKPMSDNLASHQLKESATAELRWRNGSLEQLWMVFCWECVPDIDRGGEIPHKREWRVVPSVIDVNSEPLTGAGN